MVQKLKKIKVLKNQLVVQFDRKGKRLLGNNGDRTVASLMSVSHTTIQNEVKDLDQKVCL
jgi:hypothetical protein